MTLRIYLDTNVFIDAFESDDMPVTRGRRVLDHVGAGGAIGVISELVVAELLVKPIETGDFEMQEAYENLFHSTTKIETQPIDRSVLMRAASLRATSKMLKMPDAIHVATAQIQRCAAFVTSDIRLGSATGIKTIKLDDSAVANIEALL
jgi:predicted nucleic acid-binding protein